MAMTCDQQSSQWAPALMVIAWIELILTHVFALIAVLRASACAHNALHCVLKHPFDQCCTGAWKICKHMSAPATWCLRHLRHLSLLIAYHFYLSTNAAEVWPFVAWTELSTMPIWSRPRAEMFASCVLLVATCPSYVSMNKPYLQREVLECACSLVHRRQFPWEDRALLVLVVRHFWTQRYWCFRKAR